MDYNTNTKPELRSAETRTPSQSEEKNSLFVYSCLLRDKPVTTTICCRYFTVLFELSLMYVVDKECCLWLMCNLSTNRFAAEFHGDRREFNEHSPAVGSATEETPQRRDSAIRGVVPPAAAVNRRLDDQYHRQVCNGRRSGDVHRL